MTNCRANTRTDRTHIRDSRHLAQLPKIPYISAHCVLSISLCFSFTGSLLKPEPIPKRAKFNATNRNAVDFHHFCGCSWWSVLNFFPSDFLGTFILRWSLGEASLLGEEKRAREKPLAQWERIQADYLLHQVWGRTKEEENAKALFLPLQGIVLTIVAPLPNSIPQNPLKRKTMIVLELSGELQMLQRKKMSGVL